MPESIFSSSWYRVATLRPRLRRHAHIHRHLYRGRPWYVLEDVLNQRVHRFTPVAHAVIGLMDGRRTVEEIWEAATETLGDDAPGQDEMIRLLAQLHAADALQSDVPPDTAELLGRYEKQEQQKRKKRLMSPFALTVPLFDPDRWLARMVPWIAPVMNPVGVALWLAIVLPALVLAGVHWRELTEGVVDHLLAPGNLFVAWLLFPVIKVAHEIGHGLMARYYGGEVHDMGLMFLVFTPVPYVDASAASAFPERRKRALVAGAGMLVEVLLAALAFYVWLYAEPGVVRSVAYNTMLIGGITTLTFNANPLLRFDGYYILSDLIEIPNLRQRSNQYLQFVLERWVFGSRDAQRPDTTGAEPAWLAFYGVAAFFYRFVVMAFILVFVFKISVVLGFLLASVALVGWLGVPLVKGLRTLFGPALRRVRVRAVTIVSGVVAGLVVAIFLVPLPARTLVEGVVWLPDEALIRVATPGFVKAVRIESGAAVRAGDVLVELVDSELLSDIAVVQARLRALEVRIQQARSEDQARAEMVREEARHLGQRLARLAERERELVLRARQDGTFVMPAAADLPGRFVRQGELLGWVVQLDRLRVRAVVPQEEIARVRERLAGTAVRLAERLSEPMDARLVRLVPAASEELPSVALGSEGGGVVAVDPRDRRGTSAVQRLFQVEVALPETVEAIAWGGRAHVRFDYGLETLASRWYRSLRQLFLRDFDV